MGMTERPNRWEWAAAGAAAAVLLVLGLTHAGAPSLWHDELVHVFVAKTLIDTGVAALPSGAPYPSGFLYHYALAGWMLVFGDGEAAVRSLSAVFMALSVLVLWRLARRLLDTPTALVAAWAFALSPWTVAWARQSRFYALMLLIFLLFLTAVWQAMAAQQRRGQVRWVAVSALLFGAGLATALHSVLFLAPVAAFAACRGLLDGPRRGQWLVAGVALGVAGLAVVGLYALTLPPIDREAIFGGSLTSMLENPARDHDRETVWYYFRWLNDNLGLGFLLLMPLGAAWMAMREGWRGLFMAMAFWAPMFVLSFVIGYRWDRFLFFAYPLGVACWAYALVRLVEIVPLCRRSVGHAALSIIILMFLFRLSASAADLAANTLEVAKGADITLARRHPQWREPCRWVREHAGDGVIISTTWLPTKYYVGRCDNWYPSRLMPGEVQESGLEGLSDVEDLAAFVAEHPKGMFLAEYFRFNRWERHAYAEDVAWVETHLRAHPEAASLDVRVYSWGYDEFD